MGSYVRVCQFVIKCISSYKKVDFYILKDFETFLELIESGVIRVTIKVDIHLDEKHYGQTYDHGCGFAIKEENITKLYSKYNIDE